MSFKDYSVISSAGKRITTAGRPGAGRHRDLLADLPTTVHRRGSVAGNLKWKKLGQHCS